MVLFATPATYCWAYDYFWLCVGAYSSVWSWAAVARTSAWLILTHDPVKPVFKDITVTAATSNAQCFNFRRPLASYLKLSLTVSSFRF